MFRIIPSYFFFFFFKEGRQSFQGTGGRPWSWSRSQGWDRSATLSRLCPRPNKEHRPIGELGYKLGKHLVHTMSVGQLPDKGNIWHSSLSPEVVRKQGQVLCTAKTTQAYRILFQGVWCHWHRGVWGGRGVGEMLRPGEDWRRSVARRPKAVFVPGKRWEMPVRLRRQHWDRMSGCGL